MSAKGRKGIGAVAIIGLLVILVAVGTIGYLWVLFNRPIDLYSTMETSENKFIKAIHVMEEARLYIKKAMDYSLQLAVIEVSDKGGFLRASRNTESGKPYLTTLKDEGNFPDYCPDEDRRFEMIVNPNDVMGALEPVITRVLESIRANVPEKLNEYADLFTEFEVSNKVNISVYDKAVGEDGFKKHCLFMNSLSSDLTIASEAGASWVKVPVRWKDIETVPNSSVYDWSALDLFYEKAEAENIEVIPVLGWAPEWALSEKDKPADASYNYGPDPNYFTHFAKFAEAMVTHIEGKGWNVNYVVPWLAPNVGRNWSPRGIEPIEFARLFKQTSLYVKDANPSVKIIFPATLAVPTCGYDRYPSDPRPFSTYLDNSQACATVECGTNNCLGLRYIERCGTSYSTHENLECLPTLDVDCTQPDTPDGMSGDLMECQSIDYWQPYMYDVSLRPENLTRFRYFTLSDIDFVREMYFHGLSDYFDILEFQATGTDVPQDELEDCDTSSPSTCRGVGRLKLYYDLLWDNREEDKEIFVNAEWPGLTPASKSEGFARNLYILSADPESGVKTGPICVPESYSEVVRTQVKDETFSPWGGLSASANHTTKVATIRRANQEVFATGFGMVTADDNSTGKLGFSITEIIKEARLIAKDPERAIMSLGATCSAVEGGEKCPSGFFKRSDTDSCDTGTFICPDGLTGSGSGDEFKCVAELSAPYTLECKVKTAIYNYSCSVDSAEYPGSDLDREEVRPNSCYIDEDTGAMGICTATPSRDKYASCDEMNPYSKTKGPKEFVWCRNIDDNCCQWAFSQEGGGPLGFEMEKSIAAATPGGQCRCIHLSAITAPAEWQSPLPDGKLPPGGPNSFWPEYAVECPAQSGISAPNPGIPCCDDKVGTINEAPFGGPHQVSCNWRLGAEGWAAKDLTAPGLGTVYQIGNVAPGSAYYSGCRNDLLQGHIEVCKKADSVGSDPKICPGFIKVLESVPGFEDWKGQCEEPGDSSCFKEPDPAPVCYKGGELSGSFPNNICTDVNCKYNPEKGETECDPDYNPHYYYTCPATDYDSRPQEILHIPCGDYTQDARGMCVTKDLKKGPNPYVPDGNSYQIPPYKREWQFTFLKPGVDYSKEWWQDLDEVKFQSAIEVPGGITTDNLKIAAQAYYDSIAASPESVISILTSAGLLDRKNPGLFETSGTITKTFLQGIGSAESGWDVCSVAGLGDGGIGLFALQIEQFCSPNPPFNTLPGFSTAGNLYTDPIDVPADTAAGCGPASPTQDSPNWDNGRVCNAGITPDNWRNPEVQAKITKGKFSGMFSFAKDCPGYYAYMASGWNRGPGAMTAINGNSFGCSAVLPANAASIPYSGGTIDGDVINGYPAKVLAWMRVFEEAYGILKDAGPGAMSIVEVMQAPATAGRPWGNINPLPEPLSFHKVEPYVNSANRLLNTCGGLNENWPAICWFAPPLPTLNHIHFKEQKERDVKVSYLDCEVTITNARWALSSALKDNLDSGSLEGVPDEFKFGLQFAYRNRDCERGVGADWATPAIAKGFNECTFVALPDRYNWSLDPPGIGSNKYWPDADGVRTNPYTGLPETNFEPGTMPGSTTGMSNHIPGCCGYSKAEEVKGEITFTYQKEIVNPLETPSGLPPAYTGGWTYDAEWWKDLADVYYAPGGDPAFAGKPVQELAQKSYDGYMLQTADGRPNDETILPAMVRAAEFERDNPGVFQPTDKIKDLNYILAIATVESRFTPCTAESHGLGLFALMPYTFISAVEYPWINSDVPGYGDSVPRYNYGSGRSQITMGKDGCVKTLSMQNSEPMSSGRGIDPSYWLDPITNSVVGIGRLGWDPSIIYWGKSPGDTLSDCKWWLVYSASLYNGGQGNFEKANGGNGLPADTCSAVIPSGMRNYVYPAAIMAMRRIYEERYPAVREKVFRGEEIPENWININNIPILGPLISSDPDPLGTIPIDPTKTNILNGNDALCEGDWWGKKLVGDPTNPSSDGGGDGTVLPVGPGEYCAPVDPSRATAIGYQYGGGSNYCHGGYHNGVDMWAPEGTPIRAVQSGEVVQVRDGHRGTCRAGLGTPYEPFKSPHCTLCTLSCYSCSQNSIVILHDDGIMSNYIHIRPDSAKVSLGQRVERGQHIADMGTEGCAPTGSHLHFAMGIYAGSGEGFKKCAGGGTCCQFYGFWGPGRHKLTVDPYPVTLTPCAPSGEV